MRKLLEVRELTVAFGDRKVVNRVSLDVGLGEVVALVGESGSGKTIAARSLLGLLPDGAKVEEGCAQFEGRDLLRLSESQLRRIRGARAGLIFQEPMSCLNPSMRVGSQIVEALRLHSGVSEAEARSSALAMLARVRVPNPEQALDRYPHEFSGGMRQRLMIASVMLLKPALILADEPTTALDVLVQKEVLELIVELARDTGAGVLLITHDLGLVAEYAQRVVVMRQGKIVESGTTEAILSNPGEDYTRALLGSLPSRGALKRLGGFGLPLVEVSDATVRFRTSGRRPWQARQQVRALNGVSLTIAHGETLAIVGESGSGKTTLARAMLGLVPLSAGAIHLGGVDVGSARGGALRKARQRVRMVFQDPFSALDPRMRVGAIVAEGLGAERQISNVDRYNRVISALAEVGLPDTYGRFPHQLSGGQRQRINIARALISNPDLVIADEPVSALDVTVQADVLRLLEELQARRGFGCMFISHALGVVEQVADRVLVLRRGCVVEIGDRDSIFDRPQHPYTRALLQAAPRLRPRLEGGYELQSYPSAPVARPSQASPSAKDNRVGDSVFLEVAPGHLVSSDLST